MASLILASAPHSHGSPVAPTGRGRTTPLARRHQKSRGRAAIAAGTLILGLVTAMAVAVPALSPYGVAEARPSERLRTPELGHPFGTDRLGRDQFTRAAHGARTSVGATATTLALSLAIGVGLGLLAGFRGGLADGIVMRVADVALSVPTLVVAIVVAALFGPALLTVVVVATAFNWANYARVTRAIVRQVRHEPFVDAARAIGATPWRIATREIGRAHV